MSKILKAEYYEPRERGFSPYGVLYYASGRRTSFYMKWAPKTFNAFCLKCEPFFAGQSDHYDVWEYSLSGRSKEE